MKIDKMEKDELTYHVPVLLKESVDGMNIHPDGTYVDVTFGGAGHSREILSRLGEGGRLLGFDQDEDAERNIVNDPHFTFVRSNFRYLQNFLRYHDIEQVDAILADLGVSSHHFDDSERGFSFRFDGALDMRMNKRAGLTAADIINTYEEERLANIFYLYGELKNSRKLASVIVKARNGQSIRTIGAFRTRTGEKRTGESISGTPYRSESGNGSAERNAGSSHRSAQTGGTPCSDHVSLTGRPHGEEYNENRKRRRESGNRLLWKSANSVPVGQQ